uniref:Uncharacterized protein n=1 Tax=Mycena chlorophos TaxID=658473 RepID=A0ABQ0KY09_MYCCL|nr:predicted protein [Mycena chlorophos]
MSHPWLSRSLLRQALPYMSKTVSSAANKSTKDLERVAAHCRALSSGQTPRFYLPLVFINLDPTSIPQPSDAEEAAELAFARGLAALEIMNGVANIPLPALQELWAGVWPWLLFIEAQAQIQRPDLERHQLNAVLLGPLTLMARDSDESTIQLVLSSSGILPFLGRRWDLLHGDPLTEESSRNAALAIHGILRFADFSNQAATLDEIAEGLRDGTPDLIRLIVDGIGAVFPAKPAPGLKLPLLPTLYSLMPIVKAALGREGFDGLFTLGVVTNTTKLLIPLCGMGKIDLLEQSLAVLGPLLAFLPRYAAVAESLDARLFPALATILLDRRANAVSKEVILTILCDILPAARVFRPVVSAAKKSLEATNGRGRNFVCHRPDPDITRAWRIVGELYNDTVDELEAYEKLGSARKQIAKRLSPGESSAVVRLAASRSTATSDASVKPGKTGISFSARRYLRLTATPAPNTNTTSPPMTSASCTISSWRTTTITARGSTTATGLV